MTDSFRIPLKLSCQLFESQRIPLLYRRHSFYYNLWLFLRRLLRWLLYLSKNDLGIMKNAATFLLSENTPFHCQTIYGIFCSHKPIIIEKTYFNLIIYARYYFISDQFISNYHYVEKILLRNRRFGNTN